MKPAIFKDTSLQKQFDEEGYVVIPWLDARQVEDLRHLYFEKANIELHTELSETTRRLGYETNQIISERIKNELGKREDEFLKNHIITGGTFLIKKSKVDNELRIHQDWNIVDEEQHISSQFWIPLQDVDERNGAIILIPGSHRFFKTYRSGSIHPPRFPSSIFIEKKLERALKTIRMRAGEALIYQHNLYHGSHPNPSDENRLIASGSILDQGAKLRYYHWPSEAENLVQVVDGEGEFYLEHIEHLAAGRLPEDARILNNVITRPYYPNEADILAKTQAAFPRKSFLKRLFYD